MRRKFAWWWLLPVWFVAVLTSAAYLSNPRRDGGSDYFLRSRIIRDNSPAGANRTGLPCCAEVWVEGYPGEVMVPVITNDGYRGKKVHNVLIGVPDGPGQVHREDDPARSVYTAKGRYLITRYHLMVGSKETATVNVPADQWSSNPN